MHFVRESRHSKCFVIHPLQHATSPSPKIWRVYKIWDLFTTIETEKSSACFALLFNYNQNKNHGEDQESRNMSH